MPTVGINCIALVPKRSPTLFMALCVTRQKNLRLMATGVNSNLRL